ncbi:MAG: hypothetical protein WA655_12075 [Candidatus Korobacteraceae bacterium]
MGHSQKFVASDRLEAGGEAGISAALLDARWLGCKIREFFANKSDVKGPFCLLGIRTLVRFPPYKLRRSAVTFFPRHSVGDWPPMLGVAKIPDRQALLAENTPEGVPEYRFNRVLVVGQEETPKQHLLEHPKRWRLATREALREWRRLPEGPLPFFARHQRLYFDKDGRGDELTLQLILVLSRWGLAEITSADLDSLTGYVCQVCHKRRETFRVAAQETVNYLLTNWVMPEHPWSFRAYIKRVAYGQYSAELKRTATVDEGERGDPHRSKGLRRLTSQAAHGNEGVSVRDLANRAGLHHQRVHEVIRAGKLRAAWKHGRRSVDASDAERFLRDTEVKRASRALRKVLMQAGKEREAEALRKKVYRLKRRGASDEQILEVIRTVRETSG